MCLSFTSAWGNKACKQCERCRWQHPGAQKKRLCLWHMLYTICGWRPSGLGQVGPCNSETLSTMKTLAPIGAGAAGGGRLALGSGHERGELAQGHARGCEDVVVGRAPAAAPRVRLKLRRGVTRVFRGLRSAPGVSGRWCNMHHTEPYGL